MAELWTSGQTHVCHCTMEKSAQDTDLSRRRTWRWRWRRLHVLMARGTPWAHPPVTSKWRGLAKCVPLSHSVVHNLGLTSVRLGVRGGAKGEGGWGLRSEAPEVVRHQRPRTRFTARFTWNQK